jgi:hypothetical protein
MTAKEYLERYREAVRLARQSEIEYLKELELIDAVRSPLGNDGTGSGGKISKTTEDKAIRLAEKAEAVRQAGSEALRIRQEVYDVVRSVRGEAGSVLYERYIALKSWDEVAKTVGYSKRHCKNLEAQGLGKVKDFLLFHSDHVIM